MFMLPPRMVAHAAPPGRAGQHPSVPPVAARWSHREPPRPSALARAVHAGRSGPGRLEQRPHEDARIGAALVGPGRDRDVLLRQPAHGRAEAEESTGMPERWSAIEVEALD